MPVIAVVLQGPALPFIVTAANPRGAPTAAVPESAPAVAVAELDSVGVEPDPPEAAPPAPPPEHDANAKLAAITLTPMFFS